MSQVDVEEQLKKEIRGVSEYLLEVHGLPPGRKGDGVTRLIHENLNGLQSVMLSKNGKLEKARWVIDDLQVDIVCTMSTDRIYGISQIGMDSCKCSTVAKQSCGRLHPITGTKT